MAPHVRRLIELRRRRLGLDAFRRYDLQAPLDPVYEAPKNFADAERLVLEGLEPLGPEYRSILERAFRERWVDRAENVGKRSGAFCATVYGVHPYVFMNWRDNLRTTLALAHELGHAGHGQLGGQHQAPSNASSPEGLALAGRAGPRLFLEAPSTANELLVGRRMLETAGDARLRRFVVEQLANRFLHHMMNHLLQARLERRLYGFAEADRPITTRMVLDEQAAVFEGFFGDAVVTDDGARLFWAQLLHFYIGGGLYPYTYAAGLACAHGVVEAIRRDGRPAAERWLDTLRLGASRPALELAAHAGVDMASAEPLERAVGFFGHLVDELEEAYR
jgi:oligoendopeptidase F